MNLSYVGIFFSLKKSNQPLSCSDGQSSIWIIQSNTHIKDERTWEETWKHVLKAKGNKATDQYTK